NPPATIRSPFHSEITAHVRRCGNLPKARHSPTAGSKIDISSSQCLVLSFQLVPPSTTTLPARTPAEQPPFGAGSGGNGCHAADNEKRHRSNRPRHMGAYRFPITPALSPSAR